MKKCNFDKAWVGRCKVEIEDSECGCKDHKDIKCCVCGEQATGECDHTAQFVCGFPLCDNCTGAQKPNAGWGLFGFGGHHHIRKSDLMKNGEQNEIE